MARQAVTFVGRMPFAQAACAQGIHVMLPGGETWRLRDVDVATDLAGALRRSSLAYDAVLLCMKAYALDRAIDELRSCADTLSNALFITFQNGVGSEEKLATVFGERRVLAATLTSPIAVEGPAAVRLERWGGGVGLAALWADRLWQPVAHALSRAPLLGLKVYADWRAMKWSKLLLNIMGNATSALLSAPVAEIYHNRRLFALEMRMLREALRVMAAHAPPIAAVNLPGHPARFLALALKLLPDSALRALLSRRVAQGRGNKYPSLYYDVAARSGRSEVNVLNGAVAEIGRKLGVPTPVNAALTELVQQAIQPGSVLLPQVARRALEQLARV
jgi:2-dehydropantoate 2-reductase